jgi:hypothetical protein
MSEMETSAPAQESSTPATTQTAEQQPAASPQTPVADATGGVNPVEGQPTEPVWKPDFKFKYRDDKSDNQIEGEIDDWARGIVTNKEIEEKLKAIYSKAHGLDFIKNKHSRVVEEFKNYRTQYEPVLQSLDTLSKYYDKGDMESFFRGLNISDDKIYKYVSDKLKYQELNPEQRAEHDRVTQTQRQAHELEQQNQMLQYQYQQAEIRNREIQLNNALSAPQVQQMSVEFDKRVGKEGAFRDEVIMRGVALFQKTGRDYTPEEVIQTMQSMLTPYSPTPPVAPVPPTAAMAAPAQKAAPTIPNVGGKNSAPVKKSIKSLDELRKHASSME